MNNASPAARSGLADCFSLGRGTAPTSWPVYELVAPPTGFVRFEQLGSLFKSQQLCTHSRLEKGVFLVAFYQSLDAFGHAVGPTKFVANVTKRLKEGGRVCPGVCVTDEENGSRNRIGETRGCELVRSFVPLGET